MAEDKKENIFLDAGPAGYRESAGYVDDEFMTRLRGTNGRRVYREMGDNDPTIGSILFGVKAFARKARQNITPANESINAKKAANFVEEVYSDMNITLDAHISEVMEMLIYGFSTFEIIAKQRNGYEYGSLEKCSKFDDGLIGIAKFAPRPQENIWQWIPMSQKVDGYPDNGVMWGYEQQPPSGGNIRTIPLSRSLHYIANPRKGNPEGVSCLRNSYRPWYFMKNIQEYEAIGIERNLSGFPVVYIPATILNGAAGLDIDGRPLNNPQLQAKYKIALAAYQRLASDVKKNSRGGAVLSSDTYLDKDGNPTAQRKVIFDLLSTKANDMKAGEVIARYQQDIARTFFAQFLMLGTNSASGNKALSQNISDLFLNAMDGWMEIISSVHNMQLLPYLWSLNASAGFKIEDMPEVSFDSVQPTNKDELAKIMTAFVGAGIEMDQPLEDYFREQAGAPEKVVETAIEEM